MSASIAPSPLEPAPMKPEAALMTSGVGGSLRRRACSDSIQVADNCWLKQSIVKQPGYRKSVKHFDHLQQMICIKQQVSSLEVVHVNNSAFNRPTRTKPNSGTGNQIHISTPRKFRGKHSQTKIQTCCRKPAQIWINNCHKSPAVKTL